MTVPQPVVWTNPPTIGTPVVRANGMAINWTGGDPNGTIWINGGAWVNNLAIPDAPPRAGAQFSCRVRAAPGTFTVPDTVTRALPAFNPNNPAAAYGFRSLTGFSAASSIQASGLDGAIAHSIFEGVRADVRFQ